MLTESLRKSLDKIAVEDGIFSAVSQNFWNKELVLLGEASHGTHEYYARRSEITKELVAKHDFRFIAVEGDWPSCFEINMYIKGVSPYPNAFEALCHSFERWPRWMWVNEDVRELVEWLRVFNLRQPEDRKVGFYGLDVYSLWESLDMLFGYFRGNQEAMDRIRRVYSCFDPYERDEHLYASATNLVEDSCEDEVSRLLENVLRQRVSGIFEANLTTIVNALVIKNAENYYRSMMAADDDSWNIRDRHMDTVLASLCSYFEGAKAVVWEHNTHVGDARATDMAEEGLVNLGQLARVRYGREKVGVLGFGSYAGSVVAGRNWGSEHQTMELPKARAGSWESLLHAYGSGNDLLLLFDEASRNNPALMKWRGHRAIGVVYHPEYEMGNYVPTKLPERYDAFWYLDRSHAIIPLVLGGREEELETYPTGM